MRRRDGRHLLRNRDRLRRLRRMLLLMLLRKMRWCHRNLRSVRLLLRLLLLLLLLVSRWCKLHGRRSRDERWKKRTDSHLRTWPSRGCIELQTAHDPGVKARWNERRIRTCCGGRQRLENDLHRKLGERRCAPIHSRHRSGEHLERDQSERPNIGRGRDLRSDRLSPSLRDASPRLAKLLGRGVRRRSDVCRRLHGRLGELCDSEVDDLEERIAFAIVRQK